MKYNNSIIDLRRSDVRNMKKRILCSLLMVMAVFVFTGCKTRNIEDRINYTEVEQIRMPEEGETVAEIVVQDYGSIFVYFFEEAAPKAVENFITHAKNGYYDGLTFHRVINDFMIQSGDPKGTGKGGESIWGDEFEDEFNPALQPYRGALCMANAGADTNGSQFFIVQSDDTYTEEDFEYIEDKFSIEIPESAKETYDELGGTPWLYLYHTVFGQIYEGYEVLDQIAGVDVDDSDMPTKSVVIETIRVFEYEE